MTAAEFARKHGIPYQDVRQALPMTPTRRKESWALEFPEDELRQALLKRMEGVRAFHRERAGRAGPGIWEDIGQLLELVDRIQNAMLKTMPESRDEYYSAYARHGHYELHIDGPVKTARHLLITDRHLAAMADAAMRSECILCMREGSEIGKCELREALLETAAPTEIQDGIWDRCEYRNAAGQLVLGRDVTV